MSRRIVSRVRLIGLALVITAAIVFAGNAATDLVLGDRLFGDQALGFIDAPDVAILHLIFTGLPFYALAACAERRSTMWVLAVALTTVLWVYAIWQIWQDSLSGFAGGANIGLGLIMMAGPIAITAFLVTLSFIWKART